MDMIKITLIKNEEATATLGEFISSFGGTFSVLGILGGILYELVLFLMTSCLAPCFIPITLPICSFILPFYAVLGGGAGWVLDYIVSLTTAT